MSGKRLLSFPASYSCLSTIKEIPENINQVQKSKDCISLKGWDQRWSKVLQMPPKDQERDSENTTFRREHSRKVSAKPINPVPKIESELLTSSCS